MWNPCKHKNLSFIDKENSDSRQAALLSFSKIRKRICFIFWCRVTRMKTAYCVLSLLDSAIAFQPTVNIIYVNEKSLRVKSYRTEQIEQSINLPALGEVEIKGRHWWNDLPSLYIHGRAIMYSSRNLNQMPWAVCWCIKQDSAPALAQLIFGRQVNK